MKARLSGIKVLNFVLQDQLKRVNYPDFEFTSVNITNAILCYSFEEEGSGLDKEWQVCHILWHDFVLAKFHE